VERLNALIVRHNEVSRLSTLPDHIEAPVTERFNTNGGVSRTLNPFDLTELRFGAPGSEIRGRALSAVERMARVSDEVREQATRSIERHDDKDGKLSLHVLATGSDEYREAAEVYMQTGEVRPALSEARALTLGGTAGYAVPFVLDPTVISTNAGTANAIRQVSTVKTTLAKTWHGVTSSGITASYGAESSVAADGTPTLVQPAISAELAKAFVPYSFEAGEDWSGMDGEITSMLADAKDNLEATKFTVGAGSGSNEPKGVITAVAAWNSGSSVVSPATAETFAVADVYALEEALPARARKNATYMANRAIFNKVRQFDTSGGAALWERIGAGLPPTLLGYPAYEASDMDGVFSAAATAAHNYLLLIGDFSRFVIVDRIGMSVEYVQNLFDTSTGRPTGQRGILAHWRSGSDVVDGNSFRVLDIPTAA
jgi:HK97 family phage major capsid protein